MSVFECSISFQPFYTPHLLDPHELVSWVNKIRKLNALDCQKSRFSLVFAACGDEHELSSLRILASCPQAGRGALRNDLWGIRRLEPMPLIFRTMLRLDKALVSSVFDRKIWDRKINHNRTWERLAKHACWTIFLSVILLPNRT